jgi:hypothetical protein
MGAERPSQRTTGQLFELLWNALADMLGTAAAAALLRRAVRRASARAERLRDLLINRDGVDFVYAVPSPWSEPGDSTLDDLRELVRALHPILVELTGPVVVRRLGQIAALRERGIVEET